MYITSKSSSSFFFFFIFISLSCNKILQYPNIPNKANIVHVIKSEGRKTGNYP